MGSRERHNFCVWYATQQHSRHSSQLPFKVRKSHRFSIFHINILVTIQARFSNLYSLPHFHFHLSKKAATVLGLKNWCTCGQAFSWLNWDRRGSFKFGMFYFVVLSLVLLLVLRSFMSPSLGSAQLKIEICYSWNTHRLPPAPLFLYFCPHCRNTLKSKKRRNQSVMTRTEQKKHDVEVQKRATSTSTLQNAQDEYPKQKRVKHTTQQLSPRRQAKSQTQISLPQIEACHNENPRLSRPSQDTRHRTSEKTCPSMHQEKKAPNTSATSNVAVQAARTGPKRCGCCGTTNTPLWRDLTRELPLCNACGIRFKKYGLICQKCNYVPCKQERDLPCCKRCRSSNSYIKLPKGEIPTWLIHFASVYCIGINRPHFLRLKDRKYSCHAIFHAPHIGLNMSVDVTVKLCPSWSVFVIGQQTILIQHHLFSLLSFLLGLEIPSYPKNYVAIW